MTSSQLVVVGAGQAAAQLVTSLRKTGWDVPIVLFGQECQQPYQRPPLSKGQLTRQEPPHPAYIRSMGYWQERNVLVRTGTRVDAINPSAQEITLHNGERVSWSELVLATGSLPRTLAAAGQDLAGVFNLHRFDDAARLHTALRHARSVVIVGAGYVGLEVAATLADAGRTVTVVEQKPSVLARVADGELSDYFAELHRAHGVNLRLNTTVTAINGLTRAESLTLDSGETVCADVVLIAVGADPDDQLAADAGIEVDHGILVDEFGQTSAPSIYAIGDCARFPSRRYRRTIRLESVQHATDHAKSVAQTIAGSPTTYDPVPWFWSDQYDCKLQIAGFIDCHDQAKVLGAPASGSFNVEYRRNGHLVAVSSINDPASHLSARREIARATACTASDSAARGKGQGR